MRSLLVALAGALLLADTASANLLFNGGFDDNGWTADDGYIPQGALADSPPASAEAISSSAIDIRQTVTVQNATCYLVSFAALITVDPQNLSPAGYPYHVQFGDQGFDVPSTDFEEGTGVFETYSFNSLILLTTPTGTATLTASIGNEYEFGGAFTETDFTNCLTATLPPRHRSARQIKRSLDRLHRIERRLADRP